MHMDDEQAAHGRTRLIQTHTHIHTHALYHPTVAFRCQFLKVGVGF